MNRITQTKKAVAFLGELVESGGSIKPSPFATGFFVSADGISHLVTAKHVVIDSTTHKTKEDIVVFINRKDNARIEPLSIKALQERDKTHWIFHSNDMVDIAIIPFPFNYTEHDVAIIPETAFLNTTDFAELYDVFFLSYQPGIQEESRINPIIRAGAVSRINEDLSFYIDAAAFPGNSGSPVFLTPSGWRFGDDGGVILGQDKIAGRFIGLVGAYVPYKDVAISQQTGQPRVIFEENTGLSIVWSVNYITQIMTSQSFKEQNNAIKRSIEKEQGLQHHASLPDKP
ncbi:MAG: serine protease [Dehalococcoidales bacterium]|nr:serine protease [Dehalococcoidales bacterium]